MTNVQQTNEIETRDTDLLFSEPSFLHPCTTPTVGGMRTHTSNALRRSVSRQHQARPAVAAMEGLEYRQLLSGTSESSEKKTALEEQIATMNQGIQTLQDELDAPAGIPINWQTKPSGFSPEVVGVLSTPSIPDATAISADGTILLTSSRADAGPLVVRNMETGAVIKNLSYGSHVKSGAISADGRFAAATYGDRRVLVWDIEKGSILQNITTGDYSNMITFVPGTTLVAFESDAGFIIRTMDYVTGAITEMPVTSWGTVSASGTLPSGDNIIAGSDDKTVTFASRKDNTVLKKIATNGYAKAIEFSPDMKYVVLGNANNQITILDRSTWNTVTSLSGSSVGVDGYLWDLQFLQDGSTLAVIGWNGKITGLNFADLLTGKVTSTFAQSFGGAITSTAASADGTGMVVGVYETKKVYALSLPFNDPQRRDPAVITADIDALTIRRDVVQSKLSAIQSAEDSLPTIDALTKPWSIDGVADPFRATEQRGAALTEAVKNVTMLMASLEDDDILMRTHLSDTGMLLSASLEEWTTVQERLLDPRSVSDALSPEMLVHAPRLLARFSKVNEASHSLQLTLRSPYDQTYLEIDDRSGQSPRVIRQTISHAGGTMETSFSALFERMTNVGGGEFTVRMYRDESKNVLLGTVGGYFNPDSNVGAVDLQTGFGTMGATSLLELPVMGGNAVLQSWKGMQNGVPSMTAEGAGLSSQGAAWTLDLHGAQHLVTNVSFTVTSENPDAPITVRFYRGTDLVGLDTVASGSIIDHLDTEGITSVLVANPMQEMSPRARQFLDYFHTADGQYWERRSVGGAAVRFFYNNAGIPEAERSAIVAEANAGFLPYDLSITNLEIAGNVHQPQIVAEAPSISNNPDLGRSAHPYWGQSDDTLRRGPSPGYLAVGRFSESAYGVRRDVNKYSAVRITGTNGIAKICYVAYHTQASDTRLSPEYYEIYGNTVILKPGAPEQVVIYFDKEGGGVQGLNIDVQHRESMNREEIMPPEGMAIRTDILAIRNPNAGEGVGPALTEIKDLGRPVTIGQGNVLMNVWNDGLKGGTVRVITNPGTSGAKEVSFQLGAGEGKSVAMGFIVPPSGSLVVHVVLPDGSIVTDGKPLKTEGASPDRRIVDFNNYGIPHLLWVPLNDPRPTVGKVPAHLAGFTVWRQRQIEKTGDTSFADPANFEKVFVTYLETKKVEPVVEKRDEMNAAWDDLILSLPSADGIGGDTEADAPGTVLLLAKSGIVGSVPSAAYEAASTVGQKARRNLYAEALTWLGESRNNYSIDGHMIVTTTTVAGQILGGAAKLLWSTSDPSVRWNMAFMVQMLTDIPAQKIMTTIEGVTSAADFAKNFQALMRQAQYGHLTTEASHSSEIVMAAMNKGTEVYDDPTEQIRIRFDVNLTKEPLRSVAVYLGTQVIASTAAGTFIDIPAYAFNGLGCYPLSLVVTLADGTKLTPKVTVANIVFNKVEAPNGVFRTLPANGPNTPTEREILNRMLFPLEGGGWSYSIISGAHTGAGLYALDFNATDDDKRVVHAPTDGRITAVDLTKGQVTIESRLPNGTVWHTNLLHMDNILEKKLGVQYQGLGEYLKASGITDRFLNVAWNSQETDKLLLRLDAFSEAKAELKPIYDAITIAQQTINDAIANQKNIPVSAWEVIGEGGNEGASAGTHIHMSANIAGVAINQFAWADLYHKGIVATVDLGGREFKMEYDPTMQTLVNKADRLVMPPRDKGTDYALAWEDGKKVEEMERVVWKTVKYAGESEAKARWVSFTNNKHEWKKDEFGECLFITHE